ncbi:recombinase family protein [Brevundimonas sp. VNH65]|uniref:recombinase family protein n=1 Tax=Brevundimonas sp. VNH65 TaxID=3400917 RepID=UPI003C05987A
MSAPMNAPERAALYAPQGSADALAACARYADHAGLRIVTIVDEDLPGPTPLAGQALDRLLGRLADGEFEVVVAHAGEGRLVTLAAGVDADARPDPLRCALYVRCASPSEAAPHPLADQCDACEAYAVRQGWKTIAVYKDHAVSGLKTSRPSLDALLAQARRGAFDVLLVEDLSRLSRNVTHLYALLTELKGLGVAVHTVAGPVDPGFIIPEALS